MDSLVPQLVADAPCVWRLGDGVAAAAQASLALAEASLVVVLGQYADSAVDSSEYWP